MARHGHLKLDISITKGHIYLVNKLISQPGNSATSSCSYYAVEGLEWRSLYQYGVVDKPFSSDCSIYGLVSRVFLYP